MTAITGMLDALPVRMARSIFASLMLFACGCSSSPSSRDEFTCDLADACAGWSTSVEGLLCAADSVDPRCGETYKTYARCLMTNCSPPDATVSPCETEAHNLRACRNNLSPDAF